MLKWSGGQWKTLPEIYSLKYLFVHLKVRIVRCSYRTVQKLSVDISIAIAIHRHHETSTDIHGLDIQNPWPFQEPKLELPTKKKAYFSWPNMWFPTQQPICWILKFPTKDPIRSTGEVDGSRLICRGRLRHCRAPSLGMGSVRKPQKKRQSQCILK